MSEIKKKVLSTSAFETCLKKTSVLLDYAKQRSLILCTCNFQNHCITLLKHFPVWPVNWAPILIGLVYLLFIRNYNFPRFEELEMFQSPQGAHLNVPLCIPLQIGFSAIFLFKIVLRCLWFEKTLKILIRLKCRQLWNNPTTNLLRKEFVRGLVQQKSYRKMFIVHP